ncbi:putative D-aminoacylase [Exophiala viscosa]|uniref:D-aminoacylase n=1 Tax=Exophiala viscosa TaxID=2486360 RepID=A0AAN6IGA0_9EURO|nr:putative D-aminoacylase [Exophiala viscosa]KAI1621596.1 putative D-aminoacylase [Exophiala viscosa]
MNPVELFLEKATAPGPERQLPGAVLLAANKDGIIYSKCFGTHSVDPTSPKASKPLSIDTPMWIASCNKVMTAVAALQCVEKGLLHLDEDISSVLPEWKDPQVIVGFDEATGEPKLRKAEGRITLRMLLTHQSGLGYQFLNPEIDKYVAYHKPQSAHIRHKYLWPLVFEPSTSWTYGVGVDWAGQMIERVNGGQSLDAYMQEYICKPLGMSSTTFRPSEIPGFSARCADMTNRSADGTLSTTSVEALRGPVGDDEGGGGLYSSPADYIKFLTALLKNDGTLVNPASMDLLFTPCLTEAGAKALQHIMSSRFAGDAEPDATLTGGVIAPTEVDYALGGLVTTADVPGGRKAGSMSWGGLPNLSWVVDPKSDIALLYSSQLLPTGDVTTRTLFKGFEAMMYTSKSQT